MAAQPHPMRDPARRLAGALATGVIVSVFSYTVDLWMAHAGVAAAETFLDDAAIGLAAAVTVYAWSALVEERRTKRAQDALAQERAIFRERERIARDLHDSLAQDLVGVLLHVKTGQLLADTDPGQSLHHLARARVLAEHGLAEARRVVWELHCDIGGEGGVARAIAKLTQDLARNSNVRVEFSFHGDGQALSPEAGSHLLRFTQEAVSNALRHARARRIRIDFDCRPDHVRLGVEDDGRGLPDDYQQAGGFGMVSMRERATSMGGTLSVRSHSGSGTRVEIVAPTRVPLKDDVHAHV
jgi:signal transduction histidine kinase